MTRSLVTDAEALDMIAKTLSGQEWDADTIDIVARIVKLAGREIADLNV